MAFSTKKKNSSKTKSRKQINKSKSRKNKSRKRNMRGGASLNFKIPNTPKSVLKSGESNGVPKSKGTRSVGFANEPTDIRAARQQSIRHPTINRNLNFNAKRNTPAGQATEAAVKQATRDKTAKRLGSTPPSTKATQNAATVVEQKKVGLKSFVRGPNSPGAVTTGPDEFQRITNIPISGPTYSPPIPTPLDAREFFTTLSRQQTQQRKPGLGAQLNAEQKEKTLRRPSNVVQGTVFKTAPPPESLMNQIRREQAASREAGESFGFTQRGMTQISSPTSTTSTIDYRTLPETYGFESLTNTKQAQAPASTNNNIGYGFQNA